MKIADIIIDIKIALWVFSYGKSGDVAKFILCWCSLTFKEDHLVWSIASMGLKEVNIKKRELVHI